MDALLIVGVFLLGAGSGGMCVMAHQRGLRSAFKRELEDQFDKALFESVRRKRLAEIPPRGHTSQEISLQQCDKNLQQIKAEQGSNYGVI